MGLFTSEIEGKPLVVLAAEQRGKAAEMKEDLAVLEPARRLSAPQMLSWSVSA